MTDDLVKRLRETSDDWPAALLELEFEAADRIEKDAQHIDEMYGLVAAMNVDHTVSKARIEKLEAALRMVVDWDNTLEFEDSPAWGDVMEVVQKALEGKND